MSGDVERFVRAFNEAVLTVLEAAAVSGTVLAALWGWLWLMEAVR